jgi:glycosyltransferase involved in cell wall biosynthesis
MRRGPIPDRAYVREGAFIADLCRRHRPAVIHTHGFRPDVVDAAVGRYLDVPTITTVHGFTGGGWRVGLYERIQCRAFRWFDAVAAVSHPLAQRLAASGVRRDRIHVVPNAFTPPAQTLDRATARQALSIPEDGFVVGWVGRLSREKGADILLDAVARLPGVPVNVSMLGEGPDREALQHHAAELGIGERITWHGVVRDACSLFRAFDVLVLSSRTEGCPIVLFEAMATGVPIVATRVGGVPDVVSPAEASLVPAEDAAALAAGIAEVFRDREHAAARARAAHRRLLAEFQPAAWVARYDALYRRIQKVPAGAAS